MKHNILGIVDEIDNDEKMMRILIDNILTPVIEGELVKVVAKTMLNEIDLAQISQGLASQMITSVVKNDATMIIAKTLKEEKEKK